MLIISLPNLKRPEFDKRVSRVIALEFRLDLMDDLSQIDYSSFAPKNILCYRGSEVHQAVLESMISSQAIIDVDIRDYDQIRDRVPAQRLIVSVHLDEYDESMIHRLLQCPDPVFAIKIVLKARSFAEMLRVADMIELSGKTNVIFNVTGKWGFFQRVLYKFFNSVAVYIGFIEPTAEGQPDLFTFTIVRPISIEPESMIAGIIGDERVNDSASFAIYNSEFSKALQPIHFLPIPAADANEAISVISWLKSQFTVLGFAITSPFKQTLAQELGSHIRIINTIVLSDSRLTNFFYCQKLDAFVCYANTDTMALQNLLAQQAIPISSSITIYGTGACADAFIATLKKLGVEQIFLQGRNHARLTELRKKYGLSKHNPDFTDVLINASPLGLSIEDDLSILPDYGHLIDLSYSIEGSSNLAKDAETRQVPFVGGMDFWYVQHEIQSLLMLQSLEEDEEDAEE